MDPTIPLTPALTDDELLKQFTATRATTLGYIRVLVRDAHVAEDIFQETSLVVMRRIGDFVRSGNFEAWVRGIAKNMARESRRKSRRQLPTPSEELVEAIERAHGSGSTGEAVQLNSQLDHLGSCLEHVEPGQRKMLELRYAVGTDLSEIARQTGKSVGAVQVALSRLRQILLRCIETKTSGVAYGR